MGRAVLAGGEHANVKAALRVSSGGFVATGIFSFFINLLMLTSPLYMLQVYDRVLNSRSVSTLIALTALAGGLLVIMGLLEFVRSRILVRISNQLNQSLNPQVFLAGLEQRLRGDLGERVQGLRDLDGLRQFLTGPGPFALFDSPWVPFYIAVIFLFHPVLGLIALFGAIILFVLALLSEVLTRKPLGASNVDALAAYAFAESTLRNAEAVRAMGMVEGIQRRWTERHGRGLAFQAQASDRAGALTACSKALRMALQVGILGAGAFLAIHQEITPGVMIAASILLGRALAPVEQVIGTWRQFIGARMSYHRLRVLLRSNAAPATQLQLPRPKGHISVEGLIAAPPGVDKPIIKGLSFDLLPGETLGVVGPSACGKSTLARLLVGVWHPQSGAVRLDGAELRNWNQQELGAHIGYLPQDVELLEGTVAENIARFQDDPKHEDIIAAAEIAGAHKMILHLPKGYGTNIGDDGSFLSGGQRQRIALARAVYGNPSLVVLDEPNSNLDVDGDQALTAAIRQLTAMQTTVVVMAHRPSAIEAVDKLLMLRDGRIEALKPKNEILPKITPLPVGGRR